MTERDVYTNYWALRNKPVETKAALEKLAAASRGEWVEVQHSGAGRPARKFQLLPASASAQLVTLPAQTDNSADADAPNSQKNEAPVTAEAVDL